MGRKSGLGGYITPGAGKSGGQKGGNDNPRRPDADYFVRGGEMKDREMRATSAITTARRVNPDNPKMANKGFLFAADYSKQMPIVPRGHVHGLFRGYDKDEVSTMNKDGKPAAALPNIQVGGGEDDRGNF